MLLQLGAAREEHEEPLSLSPLADANSTTVDGALDERASRASERRGDDEISVACRVTAL